MPIGQAGSRSSQGTLPIWRSWPSSTISDLLRVRPSPIHMSSAVRAVFVSVAARGCLSPWTNVCVAVPANQISSAIRVFFQNFGNAVLSSSVPLIPSPPFPSHPSTTLPYPTPSAPLEVGPLNQARRPGECCKLPPSDFWSGAPAEFEFGAF